MLCKKQKSLKFKSTDDISIKNLFEDILDFIEKFYDDYGMYTFDCDALLLDFWIIQIPEEIQVSNVDSLKNKLSKEEIKSVERDIKIFGSIFGLSKKYWRKIQISLLEGVLKIIDPYFYENELSCFLNKFNKEWISKNQDYILYSNSLIYYSI